MILTFFGMAVALSLLALPLVRRFSAQFGLVAAPRPDRWHTTPTPKIGGVGIFVAFTLTLLGYSIIFSTKIDYWPLLVGAVFSFLLGLIDDIKRLSPPAKLIGQIIAAAIIVFFGRNINFFSVEIVNIIFTVFWLIGITNAINLLDNMDGLAGGISFIAAGLLAFLFWQAGRNDLMMVAVILAGSIFGFLVFNFPPASIFMGDSGSLFLGFTLAALAITRQPQASNLFAVLGIPIMLFLLPILDTTLVTITRILQGRSPTEGGRDHTSHRLIAFGLSERQTLLTLYGVTILAGILGVIIESIDYKISLILLPIVLVTLTLLTAYLGRLKVVNPQEEHHHKGFTNLVIGLTFRGRILEILFDLIIISIAYYFSFWVHYGTQVDIINLVYFTNSLPIALASAYISFFSFGIYRGVFQYSGIRDLLKYGFAAFGGALLTGTLASMFFYPIPISLRIFIIFAAILFLGVVISRSSFTILDQIYSQQNHPTEKGQPVLIYGAGDQGLTLLRWLSQNKRLNLNPVGFLDDDHYKHGRQILGVQILGDIDIIEKTIRDLQIEGVVISSDQILSGESISRLKEQCQIHAIWLKILKIQLEDLC